LFIAAVLSFISGIYIQTVFVLSLVPVLILFFASGLATFLTLLKKRQLTIVFILISFLLAGILRIGIAFTSKKPDIEIKEATIFTGTIVESSKQIKTISLSSPTPLKGLKTIFRTDENIDIGNSVKVFGNLSEIEPTFSNPYIISWKWLKYIEGIHHEVKGRLISSTSEKNIFQRLRNFFLKKIDQSEAKQAEIIKAITIGDKTSLDDNIKTLFLKTGTSHILAISGLHVGIISGFIFFLIKWLIGRHYVSRLSGRDKKYASLLTIPFVWFFMLLSGSGISTIRATIMITVFLLSIVIERQRDILNTVAFGAFIILSIYPHSIFMPSFQLSFASVTFIIIIASRSYNLLKTKNRALRWLLSSTISTSAATIGTMPIVAYHFYGFNPFCIIHNLISIPIMCMAVVPMGLIGAILPHGEYLLKLAGEITNLNVYILGYLNIGYFFPTIRPNLFESTCFYALIFCIIFINRNFVRYSLCFFLIPMIVLSIVVAVEKRFSGNMCLNFIDVGLGEAILIEAPKGIRILVDGGSNHRGNFDTGKHIITPILLSRKILTLDYIVNTHPHGDHIGGLPFIIENFNVRNFATTIYSLNDRRFDEILSQLNRKNIQLTLWKSNDSLAFSNVFKLFVLHPPSGYPAQNPNTSSLVFKLLHKDTTFLLTGDIESYIEEMLVLSSNNLKADVLKVPHHGSNNSSSMPFLKAIKPCLAIMSVGKGIKGLPGKDAIERYKTMSIPVLSTQNHGFIQVCSDGKYITYNTFKK